MEPDSRHPVVEALTALIPEAWCIGCAYGTTLPDPRSMPPQERSAALREAQDRASELCIARLLSASGHAPRTVPRGPGGERLWPSTLVGGLTHKGALVLGAVALGGQVHALGIDLERHVPSDVEIQGVVAPEGLPSGVTPALGTVLVFAAKEAVFKAQYPRTQELLNFADIRLRWSPRSDTSEPYMADCERFADLQVRLTVLDLWVLAAAIQPAT